MKIRIKTLILGAVMFLTVSAVGAKNAAAETLFGDYLKEKGIDVSVSASVDFYNKYVWRGFLLDGDPVLQPSVTFGVNGFEGGFWGSWDLEGEDELAGNEVDGWIGYSFDLGFIDEAASIVTVSVGHTWYGFPQGDTGLAEGSQSKEFYAGVAIDTFLSPYFTWYGDYADESSGGADGNYYMFGIGHSFTLVEDYGISLDLGFEVGLNDEAFIAEDGGYTLSTIGLTIPLTENATLAPVVAFSSPFGDIEEANNDELYAGVSMGFSM